MRKFLSVFLVLTMLFSSFATVSFAAPSAMNSVKTADELFEIAADDTQEAEFNAQEAIAVDSLEELQQALAKDNGLAIEVTKTIEIPEASTVNIDLNGKTVNAAWENEANGKHIYVFKNYGSLTISGAGVINTRGIFNYGELTLNEGTINAIDCNGGYGIINYSGADFTMNGGTLAAIYEDGDAAVAGNFDATALRIESGATAEINDGNISSKSNFTYAVDNAGDLTVSGGTIEGRGGITVNGGTVTITNGNILNDSDNDATGHAVYVAAGKVKIEGGKFTATNDMNDGNSVVYVESGAAAEITDGTFVTNEYTKAPYGPEGNTIEISGGKFDKAPADKYIAEDFEFDSETGCVVDSTPAAVLSGAGTEEDPYLINNLDDLKAFRDDVNAGNTYEGKYVALMADIDLTGEVWTPIGTSCYDVTPTDSNVKMFAGNFDGENHTITGLSSDGYVPAAEDISSGEYCFALFGYVYGANISNVKLADVNINGTTRQDSQGNDVAGSGVAALIGYYVIEDEKASVIDNCHVLSGTVKASNNMGGLIGYMDAQNKILTADITIKNCTNAADVTAEAREAGGILGLLNHSNPYGPASMYGNITFLNCSNTGDVTALDGGGSTCAGGILGRDATSNNYKNVTVLFDTCSNSGTITVHTSGESHAAGLGTVYNADGSWLVIKDSTNTGNTIATESGDKVYVGGLMAYAGVATIENSTSTGTVTVGSETGNKYIGSANQCLFLNEIDDFADTISGEIYYLNGGTAPESDALYDNSGNPHLAETAYKDGFEFGGWYDNADFTGEAYTALDKNVKTYYAKWIGFVAEIDGTGYNSLAEAIAAADDGDTITLLTGVEENLTINKSITLDGAEKNYSGTISISGSVDVTVQNVTFVKGYIEHTNSSSATGNLIVKDCSFANGGYAVTTSRIKSVTIEDCTVNNQSLLYAKLSTPNITVKNVDISGGNYVAHIVYGNVAYFENVTATDMTGYGIQTQNYGAKSITLKNCSFDAPNYKAIGVRDDRSQAVDAFIFEGENSMSSISTSEYAKYVLGDVDAVLVADEGYTVTAADEKYKVIYEDGAYKIEKVAKIGETYYSTLKSAIDAAQEGDTIVITKDFELDTVVTVANGKKITLDLNGKTITGTDTTSKNFSLIDNRGELTITGNGKMTLTATVDSDWNRYSAVIANNPGGKLTIESGTFEHLGGTDMAYGIDNLTNGKGTYAETIINGGVVKSTYRGVRQFLNGVEAQNILTINGGTVEGENKSIFFHDPSKQANTGTLNVTENATLNGDVYLFVTAGSKKWPVEVSIAAAALKEGATVVTGNVPLGYELVNENGNYGVITTPVAVVDGVEYITLQDAVDAANGSGTITLTDDTAGDVVINAPAAVLMAQSQTEGLVIDLAGFTHEGTFTIAEGATVTIKNGRIINPVGDELSAIESKGNTTLENVDIASGRHAVRVEGGLTTINGGNFTIIGRGRTQHAVNVSDGGEVVINSGTFTGPAGLNADSGTAVNVQANSKVTINGGTFTGGKNSTLSVADTGVLEIYGGTFDQNPASYVASGYGAYTNADGTYNVSAERSITISATPAEVVAGEEVVVTVVINGKNLANADWTLTFEPEKFKYSGTATGANADTIEDCLYLTDDSVFVDGQELATYRFTALAQTEVTTADFTISDTKAYTHKESYDATNVIATNNDKVTVKINLDEYEITTKLNGDEVITNAEEVKFTSTAHTFVVEADPAATVTYKVNEDDVTAVSITKVGTYVIEYTVSGVKGYKDVTGTFTLTVADADYVVEVNVGTNIEDDYVNGKKLVLVYTNTADVYFAFDNVLMVDVSGSDYLYNDSTDYTYTYAFVTDAIAGGALSDYEALVKPVYDNSGVVTIDYAAQDTDLNFDGDTDIRDITTAYGAINCNATLYGNNKYQRSIIKADINGDKKVDSLNDIEAVIVAAFPNA